MVRFFTGESPSVAATLTAVAVAGAAGLEADELPARNTNTVARTATPVAAPSTHRVLLKVRMSYLQLSPESIVQKIITEPERLESVPISIELAERIAVGIAGLAVIDVGIHRTLAVRPNIHCTGLIGRRAMAGVRIDRHHGPQSAFALV